MKVLVAEDDVLIRDGLVEILEAEGYETVVAGDGREALDQYASNRPDFVLLDIMMPAVNGYDVCREIRWGDVATPIIFISAKSEEIDRVLGLEFGADDFIVKPFGVREVIARIRAVTRRCLVARAARATDGATPPAEADFEIGTLRVMPTQLRARRADDDEAVELSLREVKILRLLHERRGRVVDRETFFNVCWGLRYLPNSRTLDQHISKLRKRIELDPKRPTIIRTVHGVGYRFDG